MGGDPIAGFLEQMLQSQMMALGAPQNQLSSSGPSYYYGGEDDDYDDDDDEYWEDDDDDMYYDPFAEMV